MLTLTIKLDELDETIFGLYNASDIVINDNADDYTPPELDDAMWYIDNGCIDDDGNIKPITLLLTDVGKVVVEDYEGAAAWIAYDADDVRRGEPCETSEDERNIPDILRAQLDAEPWVPFDE